MQPQPLAAGKHAASTSGDLEFLIQRQNEFKQAALICKQKGDIERAKKYLTDAKVGIFLKFAIFERTLARIYFSEGSLAKFHSILPRTILALILLEERAFGEISWLFCVGKRTFSQGFDPMIQAARAGHPVSIKQTPIPPQLQTSSAALQPRIVTSAKTGTAALEAGSREFICEKKSKLEHFQIAPMCCLCWRRRLLSRFKPQSRAEWGSPGWEMWAKWVEKVVNNHFFLYDISGKIILFFF